MYDNVELGFLVSLHEQVRHPRKVCNHNQKTIVSRGVNVNGNLSHAFHIERGVPQECSLAPYSFFSLLKKHLMQWSRKKIARHGAQVQETTTSSTICEWHQLNLAYLIKPPGLPSLDTYLSSLHNLPTHVAYLPMGHTCMHLLGALFNLHSNYVVVRACNNPLPMIIPLCNLWRPCP